MIKLIFLLILISVPSFGSSYLDLQVLPLITKNDLFVELAMKSKKFALTQIKKSKETRQCVVSISHPKLQIFLQNSLLELLKISSLEGRVPHGICVEFKDENSFRAESSQDGVITVPSGLLREANNLEDLILILAHELSHELLHHHEKMEAYNIIQFWRSDNPVAWATSDVIQKEIETEADELAMGLVYNSGLDLEQASKLFIRVSDETTTSHFSKKMREALTQEMFKKFEKQRIDARIEQFPIKLKMEFPNENNGAL